MHYCGGSGSECILVSFVRVYSKVLSQTVSSCEFYESLKSRNLKGWSDL